MIKVLNTINFSKSLHYNPFAYLKSEKDILKLVTVIIANTKGEGEKATEDFWVKAEKLLYTKTQGHTFTKKIGQTVYVVRYHFNEDAKETMQEKINRMLMTEVSRVEVQ